MIFSALASNGELVLSPKERQSIKQFLTNRNGKTVWLVLQDKRPPRSLIQNSYLWGGIYGEISMHTGQDDEEIHEFCKQEFLPRMFIMEDGEEKEIAKSTTRLTTKEFSTFIEKIRSHFGSEYGIETKSPEEYYASLFIS